jgi:hypothetical protein
MMRVDAPVQDCKDAAAITTGESVRSVGSVISLCPRSLSTFVDFPRRRIREQGGEDEKSDREI